MKNLTGNIKTLMLKHIHKLLLNFIYNKTPLYKLTNKQKFK